MTTIKTCLVLGKIKETSKLKKAILKKKWKVFCKNKKININDLRNIELVITFNYRYVLKKSILKKLKRPAINLHISYLPFNKGCHPNFWSFVEKSPKGVTIHEIDQGLDTGPIIYQKKISFNIHKRKNNDFFKTNQILLFEIQKLFFNKINQILNKDYIAKKQKKGGTFHYRNDLPSIMKNNWELKIKDILTIYQGKKQSAIRGKI